VSESWNYPYNAYRGFITGATQGPAYRQRNVFLYPPQLEASCGGTADDVLGEGTCGDNGNSKVFSADQAAGEGDTDGSISGPYLGFFDTTTELIGDGNAVLYQVYYNGMLFQSQLSTFSVNANGVKRRTRSAQSFRGGIPSSMSFYRERKVNKEAFYAALMATASEYNLLESDTCTWMNSMTGGLEATEYTPGLEGCTAHLEQSFECFYDC
jgi:hypothetical protein